MSFFRRRSSHVPPQDDAAAPSGPEPQGLRGVLIIMQTPFRQDLSVDELSLRREVDFLIRCGVHGMVWPADAGETFSLSLGERLEYSKVIVDEAKGRLPVIIGVHAPNQFEAAFLARHAADIGAAAMLAFPQTDNCPVDFEMLHEYLRAIAAASPLPIILQTSYPSQVPSPSLTAEVVLELAAHLPTLHYVKEESRGFRSLPWRISALVAKGSAVAPMAGAGARTLLNEMARGSRGTMPGAGFADIQAQIWDWYQSGDKARARDLYAKMLMMAVLELHTGYVLQKEILRRRGIFETALMRSTRHDQMDDGDHRELGEVLEVLSPFFRVQS